MWCFWWHGLDLKFTFFCLFVYDLTWCLHQTTFGNFHIEVINRQSPLHFQERKKDWLYVSIFSKHGLSRKLSNGLYRLLFFIFSASRRSFGTSCQYLSITFDLDIAVERWLSFSINFSLISYQQPLVTFINFFFFFFLMVKKNMW